MSAEGVVQQWHDDDGWGVIDSSATPGGCWAHFSVLGVSGYKKLEVGQEVEFEHEQAGQDGYAFRATRVWLEGHEPVVGSIEEGPSTAYRSSQRITWEKPF